MTTSTILRQICPNGEIQQGTKVITELFRDPKDIIQLGLLNRIGKTLRLIQITMNTGEYFFVEYKDLAMLEKDYEELKQLRNGNT